MSAVASKIHPEQDEGEVFLGNCTEDNYEENTGWETKRMGQVAYDVNGEPIRSINLFPVFVQQDEIRKKDPQVLEWLLARQ